MKQYAFLAALAVVAGVGLTACEQDTDPKLKAPTEFILNTPPMASQVYYFDQDAKGNAANDITFTVSQPDYGVGVIPTYEIQIARSAEDFALWDEEQANPAPEPAEPAEGEEGEEAAQDDAEEAPLAVTIEQEFNDATITIDGYKFCSAVNTLFGFDRETYAGEVVPVYVRAHAQVGSAKYSGIWSNIIKLDGVRSYFKLVKGTLYVIGQFQGWNISASKYVLTETAIGSNIYRGTIEVPEDYVNDKNELVQNFTLRFYNQLGDWDAKYSFGAQFDDNPVDITWNPVDGYTGPIVQGKGSFRVPDWAGGSIAIEIDLNGPEKDWTIKMTPPEPEKLYIVGQCQGWNIKGNDDYVLFETAPGSGIYKNTVNIKAGDFCFKIYGPEAIAEGNWDIDHYGAAEADGNNPISMGGGLYTGPCVDGKGNWEATDWTGGECVISIDTNTMTVTFSVPNE